MELADFFAIDRLSQHDEELLIESAMQMQQMMMLYESGIREIKTKLDILSDESRISGKPSPIDAIKSRIKSPRSIIGKLKRRGFPITLQSMIDNLNDIGGIRVICPFIEDIYTVADMLMRQDDLTLIEKKDYIANPKPNGYRQPASDPRGADFPRGTHAAGTHRAADSHDGDGFLGQPGAPAAL